MTKLNVTFHQRQIGRTLIVISLGKQTFLLFLPCLKQLQSIKIFRQKCIAM